MNNKSPADTRMQTSAILAISSLDRFATPSGNNQSQLFAIPLIQQYNNSGQPCNNFTITSGGALIYGYIKKIQVAQTQVQYNIPTVSPRNSLITLKTPAQPNTIYALNIPVGFYTPEELAAQLELLIIQIGVAPFIPAAPPALGFTVTYSAENGFVFETNSMIQFSFLNATDPANAGSQALLVNTLLRTYRLLGLEIQNSIPDVIQSSNNVPQMLYTPYIDIISQTLTKYQKVKDTDSSAQKQADIIARIYLAGTGSPQPIAGDTNVYPLGSRPFTVVQDMNYCKTMRWSKDEAVNSIDFQVRDQYGDLIYWGEQDLPDFYYTEFQMTLLCIEEQD